MEGSVAVVREAASLSWQRDASPRSFPSQSVGQVTFDGGAQVGLFGAGDSGCKAYYFLVLF